jgi:hypothetical protein
VKNPKQAIAIGLHEAGASKYESNEKSRKFKANQARQRPGATERPQRATKRHEEDPLKLYAG